MELKNKPIYFPAISVGSALSQLKKDEKHFVSGETFRYYTKDSHFHYPYMLATAAHCYGDMDFRKTIGFPDDAFFFGDSGGFQVWTGQAGPDFTVEVASEWLNRNSDIYPILDIPPAKDARPVSKDFLIDCAKKSVKNAYIFNQNRAPGKYILNVMHGRKQDEREEWYKWVSKIPLDGWALGATNFSSVSSAFFYLWEKGEVHRSKYLHIFGISKPRYILFFTYIQNILNKMGIDCTITYDSSYPFRTCAFGNYFVPSGVGGIRNLKFTNTVSYEEETAFLPCECPYCKGVLVKEFAKFTTERFYSIASFRNLWHLVEYKKNVERFLEIKSDELIRSTFLSDNWKVMKILDKFFVDDQPGKSERIEKAMETYFPYDTSPAVESLESLF